jgi:hypothetical protein
MFARLLLAALAFCASAGAWAGIPTFCDRSNKINAEDQDRVLQFAAVAKQELERSGARVALIARAGLDLSRFKLLYSHAGIAIRESADGPWAVRQLYYACDESRPRLFDQGMAGFTLGAETPARGHISLLFLPDAESALLEEAASDKRLALALLAGQYSANAYAFSTRYQNCNQWVAELIASAWGRFDGHDGDHDNTREHAQAWLREQGYSAGPVKVPSHWMMFAGQFVPLVHVNDHPVDDIYALSLRVSVPASIEEFVHRRVPQTQRVELCHDKSRIVVHRGWEQLGSDCTPMAGDEVIALAR